MNRIASGLAQLALLGLLLLPAGLALAGDTDIGCGPGTQIWDGNSGVAPKVLGATTNGSFGLHSPGAQHHHTRAELPDHLQVVADQEHGLVAGVD